MVDAWSNSAWKEESQYSWRKQLSPYNWRGGIPLNSYILNTNNAETILGIKGVTRNIRWWGGPEFIDVGNVIPLAEYSQEPKEKYPIHWFLDGKVHTDLMTGEGYSIIAATYNQGKLVLFGPHPELYSFYHGTADDIKENYLRTKYRFDKGLDYNTGETNANLIKHAVRWTLGLT
jgi:glutamine amidotransferase-like uncharacterized protein